MSATDAAIERLRRRCDRAMGFLADAQVDAESNGDAIGLADARRISGKREGVALVMSYLDEELRALPEATS